MVDLGDAIDCFQISKYPTDPNRKNSVYEDILEYKYQMDEWRDLCRGIFHQICGNHERRLENYIWTRSPEINGLVRSIPEMLGIRENDRTIFWHKYNDWKSCVIGNTVLFHGFLFNRHTPMATLDKYPGGYNYVFGHTHRWGLVSNGINWAANLGHGSDEVVTAHLPMPMGWQSGFGLLHEINGKCTIEMIEVNNGTCVLHGELIKC